MKNAEDIRLWEAFGSWITAKRLLLGLTQPEVAARLGETVRAVCDCGLRLNKQVPHA
jgi:hypothetical protein